LPETGAREAAKSIWKVRSGFGYRPAKIRIVIMIVKIGDRECRKNWLSSLSFVLITVLPWAAFLWLIWPSR